MRLKYELISQYCFLNLTSFIHHFNAGFDGITRRLSTRGWVIDCVPAVYPRPFVRWNGWQKEEKDDVFDNKECR